MKKFPCVEKNFHEWKKIFHEWKKISMSGNFFPLVEISDGQLHCQKRLPNTKNLPQGFDKNSFQILH